MKKKIFAVFFLVLTVAILIAIYFFKLNASFFFNADAARDFYDIQSVVLGNFTLIGPKLTFGGFFAGPYYYYVFVPIFWLTHFSIPAILYFNAGLYVAALGFFYYKIVQRFSVAKSFLSTICLGISPLFLVHSRTPWNGSSYLPLLLILLTSSFFDEPNGVSLSLVGFLAGVILNFHPITITVILPVLIFLFFKQPKKRQLLFFFLGISISLIPLSLFEVRHHFVMLRSTFFTSSKQLLPDNSQIASQIQSKGSAMSIFLKFLAEITPMIGLQPFILFVGYGIIAFLQKQKKLWLWVELTFFSLVLTSIFLEYQYAPHYLYPLALMMIFSLIICILETQRTWLFILLTLYLLITFPKQIYENSTRRWEDFDQVTRQVLQQKIIPPNDSFNVFMYSKLYTIFIPVGDEYRFFFRKYGATPKSSLEYNQSKYLLIFSDDPSFRPTQLDTWETQQFGEELLKHTEVFHVWETAVYKVTSNH